MADSNFVLYLILYHKTLARATGVTFDTRLIRDLVSYYVMLREREAQAIKGYLKASYLRGFIGQGQQEIARLISEADSEARRREILPAVRRLGDQIEAAALQLEALVTEQGPNSAAGNGG